MRLVGRPTPATAPAPPSPAAKLLDDKTLSNGGGSRSTRHSRGAIYASLCSYCLNCQVRELRRLTRRYFFNLSLLQPSILIEVQREIDSSTAMARSAPDPIGSRRAISVRVLSSSIRVRAIEEADERNERNEYRSAENHGPSLHCKRVRVERCVSEGKLVTANDLDSTAREVVPTKSGEVRKRHEDA